MRLQPPCRYPSCRRRAGSSSRRRGAVRIPQISPKCRSPEFSHPGHARDPSSPVATCAQNSLPHIPPENMPSRQRRRSDQNLSPLSSSSPRRLRPEPSPPSPPLPSNRRPRILPASHPERLQAGPLRPVPSGVRPRRLPPVRSQKGRRRSQAELDQGRVHQTREPHRRPQGHQRGPRPHHALPELPGGVRGRAPGGRERPGSRRRARRV